jgi:hypothetical protein
LVVIDGAKPLRRAVLNTFGERADGPVRYCLTQKRPFSPRLVEVAT